VPAGKRRVRSRAQREEYAGRLRRAAAVGFVALLAVAWIVTARAGNGDALARNGDALAAPPTTARPDTGAGIRSRVPADAQCHDQDRSAATLRCSVAGVSVEYQRLSPRNLDARYRAAIGVVSDAGRTTQGPPMCARGAEDERAWARPDAPERAAGRYACRVERGRAVMWWTVADVGLLAHATAGNRDLGTLFAWWASHSER
jgi:hypothetical protein